MWHWVDPPRAIAEAARVLRRDGLLGLFGTYSGHLVLGAPARAAQLERLGAVLDAEPRLARGEPVELPMVCDAWCATRG